MSDWNPELYDRFRRYRAEPAEMMLARLRFGPRERIVDLGCGPGTHTVELARRAADARVLGLDSSPAMIEAACALRATLAPALAARVAFQLGDIARFASIGEYTLVFSNAALQWVPDHRAVFGAILRALRPGGRIAIQMPANENETAKVELERLAGEPPWRERFDGLTRAFAIPTPEHYAEMLAGIGFGAVECEYHVFEHPLDAPAQVVAWYRATGLRPFLERLAAEQRPEFLAALTERLERAYGGPGPLVFKFRRLFIRGNRPERK